MAHLGEELAFIKNQALSLKNIPVTLDNDYQPALEDVPKKVPVFPTASSSSTTDPSSSATAGGIPILIKSTKPPLSFNLTVHPTDTVSQIKLQLEKEHLRAPTADSQRLLIKGKVLADNKLLKEYPISTDSSAPTAITLMTKPGSTWTGEERAAPSASPAGGVVIAEPESFAAPSPTGSKLPPPTSAKGHGRSLSGAADTMPLPSLTLSPTPSPDGQTSGVDLALAVELDMQPDPPRGSTPTQDAYTAVIADAEFWGRLSQFLLKEFKTEGDAETAWEQFFLVSKSSLTANQIAKIRDVTGKSAMAGL
ncbi:hypothetical protein M407DRAFT_219792 [Tulasnella calospora MUT 4182]|uniref:Ubiquitin-like domain-containing protein n=1 Tax=Tulasnella calospora MUT 4182 TaxID=1051891 RepID=A0A0C3QRP1_9AGAM|nr:hypothetical protein M407DRAFT_219792 [Tulasnella calospora MUT 4182]